MYHLHTTNALVLSQRAIGEKDLILDLLTLELGRIKARASSVRDMKSKLKDSLQEMSLLNASIVRGKDTWRLTTAIPLLNYFFDLKDHKKSILALQNIFRFTKRIISGEQKDINIFKIVNNALQSIKDNPEFAEEIEIISVTRLLVREGYLDTFTETQWVRGEEYRVKDFDLVRNEKKQIVFKINEAIKRAEL